MMTLLSPQLLWVILALVVGLWLGISWVLNYHWKTYGHHMSVVSRMRITYFVGSLIIIGLVGVLIVTL